MHRLALPRLWMALISALASAAARGTTFLLSLDAASQPPEYHIDAGSNGREQIYLLQQSGSGPAFYFSVDRVAVGMPNTAVFQESAPPNESAAADIYQAGFGTNTLYRQETALGLHPGFFGDDIDAMQIVPDPPGPPLPDVVVVNAGFPYTSLWRNSSLIGQPATINGAMPMADPDGLTPDDIVLSLGAMNLLFASGVMHMGLMAGDDLDALMLLDVTPDPNAPGGFDEVPNGIVDPGLDLAIFSLDPFSPSTFTSGLGGTRSPADLLITSFNGNYGVFRTAAQIGLLTDDNVDALSMAAVPEPGSLVLLLGGAIALRRRRRETDVSRAKAQRRQELARGPAGGWHGLGTALPCRGHVVRYEWQHARAALGHATRMNLLAVCVATLVGVCPALARPGDSDGDNDIDLVDIAAFQNAFSGSGGIIPAGGEIMDFDADGDVDLLDFAELREEMDGAAVLGNPCAALGPAVVWGGISPPVANSVATLEFKHGTNPDVFCFVLSATHPAPGINLPGPGHIAMQEQQADEVVVVPGGGGAPTRIVFSHVYIVPQGDVGAGSTITINGDLLLTPYDRGVLDVQIQPAGGGAPTTVRYLIRPLLDLDVDSDNNSTLMDRAPQRDGNEETIEDDPTMTGVIVCVNDNDNDGDGVVDFGDGFDLDANNPDDDANPDEVDFVKMVLAIGQHIDTSVASIRVTYSASDPAQAMIAGTPPVITPAPGRLRIWTQRGSEMRDKASIDNGGDYVSPGIHDASDFDFQLDAAAGQRTVDLWLEGIRPSPSEGVDRIEFAIDPDGPGPQDFVGKDAVRSTVVSIKFIETEEVAGTSILPLFNPSPIVTLDAIADPGNAEMVNINVTGMVKDYVAPIEKVRVNGAEVNVTQTSSGPDGLGPFEGTFTAPLMLTGNTTLVESTAINSLNNVGKDSTLIAVMRDMDFNLTARTVTENPSVPAAPANEAAFLDSYRFRIELRNLNPPNNQLDVQFDTGVEVKTVTLSRPGNSGPLQSKNLFLVPENLMLPGSASADVQMTRIKADLGQRPKVIYMNGTATCCAVGVTKGILIRKQTDEAIADFIESAIKADVTNPMPDVQYEVLVGLHGSIGPTIDVKLRGLDNLGVELPQPQPMTHLSPLEPTVTLTRQSSNKTDAEYHLYKQTVSPKPIMGVRTPLPTDGAGAPQPNGNITAVWVEFDGALRARYDPDAQVSVIEPVVGMEIVADRAAAPNIFKATGLIPVNNPAPPVLSVADGAPRPVIENFMVMYMPDAGNPRRFRVQADIKDQLADLINGDTLAAVGMMINIQPAPIAAPTITINRPPNDPPRPFLAHIETFVNLTNIPEAIDIQAYNQRRPNNAGLGAAEAATLKIAQEAVILQVSNAAGNRSWDSAFCQLNDTLPAPNPDGMPPFAQTVTNDNRTNPPTLYDVPPQLFFARYHNPFKTQNSVVQALSSRMGATQIASKPVVLPRKLAGNTYSFGPFAVPTTDRWVVNPPALAATLPAIIASAYMHNANGLITGEMIASTLRIDAPAPSREDFADTLPLDLRFSDQAAGGNMRDAFLPTGSDAMPTAVNITAQSDAVLPAAGIPDAVRNNLQVVFRLKQVTNFLGYCSNAPQPGPPAPAGFMNDDFSFDAGGNNQGPTAAAAFDAMGEVRNMIQSKDFGGRAVLDGAVSIPGNAPRSVLANVVVDDDGDFLPRSWERRFLNSPPVANPNNPIRDGLEDNEDRGLNGAGVVHNEKGDGFTALEEYRGFSVTFVPPGGGVLPLAMRMDEIPFAYGLAVTGTAAAGNLVAGPRVKDLLIVHQSTITDVMPGAANMTMGTQAAGLANVAWHRVNPADLIVTPMLATPAGAPIVMHNHQINPNGDNDGLTTVQNAIHLRDHGGLPAGVRARSGGFVPNNIDLQVNAGVLAGWAFPMIPVALANGRTIFHELGHKCSLRHCHANNNIVTVLTARNGMDFTRPGGGAPDGINDGEIRFTFNQYAFTGGGGAMLVLGDLLEERFLNNVSVNFGPNLWVANTVPPTPNDAAGNIVAGRLIRAGTAAGAGTFPNAIFFGRTIFPEMMDWTPYLLAPAGGAMDGVTQQIMGAFTAPQIFVPGPGAPGIPAHDREIRVRSVP